MRRLAPLVILLLASCENFVLQGDHEGRMPDAAEAENRKFESFVDAYLGWHYAHNPSSATNDGIHDYDHALGRFSAEDIREQVEGLKHHLAQFWRIDRDALTDANFGDAIVLEGHFQARLLDLQDIRPWERVPGFYKDAISSGVYSLLALRFAPAEARMALAARRLSEVPRVLEEAKANLDNPARIHTETAIDEFGGLHGFIRSIDFLADKIGHDETLVRAFETARRPALKAIEEFVDWMRKDLLPRSKGSFAIGRANYEKKLASEEMVSTPIDLLLSNGLLLLSNTQEEFTRIAASIDPAKPPARVLKDLSKEHSTAEALLDETRKMLDGIKRFCGERLVDIPADADCRVQETPSFRRATSFASMEIPGPFEKVAKDAYYSVTLPEGSWSDERKEQHLSFYNRYTLPLISIHEAYPGHYTQFLAVRQCTSKVRKVFGCASFSEGWAHYCEQLLVDEGYFGADTPKGRLAQLSMALLRICRYIVGIRLHCDDWTYEQAVEFFVKEACLERANAEREARRGTGDPTYLVYTLGKMEILRLRDEFRARTGKSLREFHNAFISHGYPPIPVVRALMLGERIRK